MTSSVRRHLAGVVNLPGRISDLENGLAENRRLERRIADLTDILTELLVPVAQRDEEKLASLLEGSSPEAQNS